MFEELQSLIKFEYLLDPQVSGTEAFSPVHGVAEASECPEEAQEKLRGQLQGLSISGEGDPCHWPGIVCYDDCTLYQIQRSRATGDLSSVKEMTKLRALELGGSQVTGNVSELAKLKDLWSLDLSQTQVVGHVKELRKLKELVNLDLSQTQVMGDLAELSNLTALAILRLSHTQVSGNVAELWKLTLTCLDLSQTQVVGDVSVLWNMTELMDLSLADSRVHGNFGVISRMPGLLKADLSGTAVSGDLNELHGGCCKKLRELHLGVPASVGTAPVFLLGVCGKVSLRSLKSVFFAYFACEDTQVRISPVAGSVRMGFPALRSFNA